MFITKNQQEDIKLLKIELKSLKGKDLVLCVHDIYGGSDLYVDPKRVRLLECKRKFVVVEDSKGKKEKYHYSDFSSGRVIFEPVDNIS